MSKARASGPGSPVIAGAETRNGTTSGKFGDYNHEFGTPNLFDFSTSPDILQTLETIGTSDPKTLMNLTLPDSPNESYQDSSSDSASSLKRTDSSVSALPSVTPVDCTMEQANDVKMEWGPEYPNFDDDDHAFTFARDMDPAAAMGGLYGFGENEDAFLDRPFDFDGVSSSAEGPSRHSAGGPVNMPASPGMPTIKTNSPRRPAQTQRPQANGHRKRVSVSATRPPQPSSVLMSCHSNIRWPPPTGFIQWARGRRHQCPPW